MTKADKEKIEQAIKTFQGFESRDQRNIILTNERKEDLRVLLEVAKAVLQENQVED